MVVRLDNSKSAVHVPAVDQNALRLMLIYYIENILSDFKGIGTTNTLTFIGLRNRKISSSLRNFIPARTGVPKRKQTCFHRTVVAHTVALMSIYIIFRNLLATIAA